MAIPSRDSALSNDSAETAEFCVFRNIVHSFAYVVSLHFTSFSYVSWAMARALCGHQILHLQMFD